jgi:hypothetical protein
MVVKTDSMVVVKVSAVFSNALFGSSLDTLMRGHINQQDVTLTHGGNRHEAKADMDALMREGKVLNKSDNVTEHQVRPIYGPPFGPAAYLLTPRFENRFRMSGAPS